MEKGKVEHFDLAKRLEREFKNQIPDYQYIRELIYNAKEAGATRIAFQEAKVCGHYVRTAEDDGPGMSPMELKTHLTGMGRTSKGTDNFGMGARHAILGGSPLGLIFITKTVDGPICAIEKYKKGHEYEWTYYEGVDEVENLDVAKKHWPQEHGTTVVILGSNGYRDTAKQFTDRETKAFGVCGYINSKFYVLPLDVHVRFLENAKTNKFRGRNPTGLKEYLESHRDLADMSILETEDATITTYLMQPQPSKVKVRGESPRNVASERGGAFIGMLYQGEEFYTIAKATKLRSVYNLFGITQKTVRDRTYIVIAPKVPTMPDSDRRVLMRKGGGGELKLEEFAEVYRENFPDFLQVALDEKRTESVSKMREGLLSRFKNWLASTGTFVTESKGRFGGGEEKPTWPRRKPNGGGSSDPRVKKPVVDGKGKFGQEERQFVENLPNVNWVPVEEMADPEYVAEYIEALNQLNINENHTVISQLVSTYKRENSGTTHTHGHIKSIAKESLSVTLEFRVAKLKGQHKKNACNFLTPECLTASVESLEMYVFLCDRLSLRSKY
jgi:hypothetical protein